MNTVTFLALVITTAHAVRVTVTLKGSFTCSYNEDDVTVEIWDWDLFADDKLSSKTVSVNVNFNNFTLSGVEDEWFSIQPYMIVRHRCNSCRKYTVIYHGFGNLDKSKTFTFYGIKLDNRESFCCFN